MKITLGLFLLTLPLLTVPVSTASAAPPADPASPDRQAKRPKFSSKHHIPVQAAAEVTSLPPGGYELVFSDEFKGDTLDAQKWTYRLDSKMLSTQQAENVSVRNGNLEIALRKESARGKAYTAGGVITKETFGYGYYEARLKTPDAEGWHTAFWSMKNSFAQIPNGPRPLLELDYVEQDGGDPHFFSFGVINQAPNAKKGETWNAGRWVIEDAPDTSADFNIWSCEFTPEVTRFYFNGRLTKELSSAGFPHDDMNVWLSVIGSALKGDRWVDESKLPNVVLVDYVRVYQNPKYRAAEDALRAASLVRPPKPDKKSPTAGGAPADLN